MLNLGDASLYSSFSYIAEIIDDWGYEIEVIPGVTSFCATAAKLKTSLTQMHKPLHILPAGEIDNIIGLEGTKVIMKSGKAIKELKKKLEGKDVKAVQNCGLPEEKICNSLEEIADDASYFTTLLIK
jgi:precorrin-2/cobalt-factor-2 C20-methyltransferase